MKLIVYVGVLDPNVSDLESFRTLTLILKHELLFDILLESENEMKDYYYHFFKKRGILDYVSYILYLNEKESGISLSYLENRPKRIKTDRITCNNFRSILGKIAATI
jgi:hypothetical protein